LHLSVIIHSDKDRSKHYFCCSTKMCAGRGQDIAPGAAVQYTPPAASSALCHVKELLTHYTSATPAAPPINESKTLSVRNWRTMRQRLEPSAARTDTSLSRAAACAS